MLIDQFCKEPPEIACEFGFRQVLESRVRELRYRMLLLRAFPSATFAESPNFQLKPVSLHELVRPARCLGTSFDFLRARNAVVLLKPFLRGAVVCERRHRGIEKESRDCPSALGAGPSSKTIVFQPNHTSTHRCFPVSLLEQNCARGEERKRTPAVYCLGLPTALRLQTISHGIAEGQSD